MKKAVMLALSLLATTSPAWAARIPGARATASSAYPPEEGVTYEADRVSDGKVSTSWVEGEQGGGLGSWIELDLGGEKTIQKLRIWGGLWYSSAYWKRANRPKDIEITYSDGSKDIFTLKDEMKAQDFALPQGRKTTSVRVKIKSVYDGSTWMDTAISELQVFDATVDVGAPVRTITASSSLPADADGSYDPMNIQDGILDSMWCEGNKTGDGAGEWLETQFPGAQKVSKVVLVNGIGTSLPYWMKGNRASAATLTFSDGTSEQITLKNALLAQTVAFPAHSTTSVRMTFSTIIKGKEFNDLCISEASFIE
jgi:hypothetical protein